MEKLIKESVEQYFSRVEQLDMVQEQVLLDILQRNRESVYGKEHHFDEIKDIDMYQKMVPLVHYAEMKSYYTQLKDGDDPVVCSERVEYYAMTSGSSGEVKYIPQTRRSLETWSHGMVRNGYGAIMTGKDILTGEYLIVTGDDDCGVKNDIHCGYISGIVPRSNPELLQKHLMYEVNKGAYSHQEKCQFVTELLHHNKVSSSGGITSHLLNIFTTCKQEDPNVLDNLQFFLSTGVNINTVKSGLKEVLPEHTWVANAYTGTEGAFAFSMEPYSDVVYLNYDLYFFEFEHIQTHEVVRLRDVQVGEPYSLVVTGHNGLYRYSVGDVVCFESVMPPKLKVIGRNSASINLIGEKYTEQELQNVMKSTSDALHVAVNNFVISGCVVEGRAHYYIVAYVDEMLDAQQQAQFRTLFAEHFVNQKALLKRLDDDQFSTPHIVFQKGSEIHQLESFFADDKKSGHVKVKTIVDIHNFKKISDMIHIDWSEFE